MILISFIYQINTRLIILLIPLFLHSGHNKLAIQVSKTIAKGNYIDPFIMINEGQTLLKEGDLVLRLNQDPISQFIKNFNRGDKSYSHAGIVLFEKGYPYIFHMVTGEENPDGKLRKDSLSRFCNPRKNIAFGIFRYEMNAGELIKINALIHKWYAKGVEFDPAFNLNTDKKMYCSEMISKALARSTSKRILIEAIRPTTAEARLFSVYLHLPFVYTSKLQIVSIDNLYKPASCHLIKRIQL